MSYPDTVMMMLVFALIFIICGQILPALFA